MSTDQIGDTPTQPNLFCSSAFSHFSVSPSTGSQLDRIKVQIVNSNLQGSFPGSSAYNPNLDNISSQWPKHYLIAIW